MKADVLSQILRPPLAVWGSSGLRTSSSRSSRMHTVCTACWEDPTRTTGLTGRLQQRGDLLDVQKKKYVKITYTTHMGLFTTVSQTDNRPDTKHKLKSAECMAEYSLRQLSQLSPFWKPAAPFMPGLLPGAMIWLGLGLVLEVERERELMCLVTVVMMEIVHWLCCNSDCYSLGGDVNLLQLAVCFRCLESFLKQT